MKLRCFLLATNPVVSLSKSVVPVGYERSDWPTARNHSRATIIELQFRFQDLWNINQKEGTFQADVYLNARWVDERLRVLDQSETLWRNCLPYLEEMWRPNLYLVNAVSQESDELTTNDCWVDIESGQVFWSHRTLPSLRCKMDFSNLPFDSQSCPIVLSDFSHTVQAVEFKFRHPSSEGVETITSLEWTNFAISANISRWTESSGFDYDRAILMLTMDRMTGGWWLTVMMPATIFVGLSYLGLWIDKRSPPARVSLDVVCVLISVTMIWKAQDKIPQVSSACWINQYMLGCLWFNITTLVSFGINNFSTTMLAKIKKHQEKETELPMDSDTYARECDVQHTESGTSIGCREVSFHNLLRLGSAIDVFMRILIPPAFLIFFVVMLFVRL